MKYIAKWWSVGVLYVNFSRFLIPVTILPTEGRRYISRIKKLANNDIKLASFHLDPGLGSLYYLLSGAASDRLSVY